MPKHPLISIPLDIPDVRVLQTELTKDGEFILYYGDYSHIKGVETDVHGQNLTDIKAHLAQP